MRERRIVRWGRVAVPAALLLLAVAFVARPALPRPQVGPLDLNGGTPFQASNPSVPFEDRHLSIEVPTPPGKRLILEFITVRVTLPQGQSVSATVSGSAAGMTAGHSLLMERQGELFGSPLILASQPITLYSDNGLTIELARPPNGRAFVSYSLSGRLVEP